MEQALDITTTPLFIAREAMSKGEYSEAFTKLTEKAKARNLMPKGMSKEQEASYLYNLLRHRAAVAVKKARAIITEASEKLANLPPSLSIDLARLTEELDAKEQAEKQHPSVTLPEVTSAFIPAGYEPTQRGVAFKLNVDEHYALAGAIVGAISNDGVIIEATSTAITARLPYRGYDLCDMVYNYALDQVTDFGLERAEIFGAVFN